jgi:hypothetical protein
MSAPELRVQQAVAAVMRLVHDAAVLRARVMLPGVDETLPTIVALEPHGPLLIERPEGTVEVPHDALPHDEEPDVPMPPTPELGPFPPFVLGIEGEVTGKIGAIDGLAAALQRMATAIGGDAVVACELTTDDPERALGVVARGNEPVVVLIGDDAYELPS